VPDKQQSDEDQRSLPALSACVGPRPEDLKTRTPASGGNRSGPKSCRERLANATVGRGRKGGLASLIWPRRPLPTVPFVKSRYAEARTRAAAILAAICPGGSMPISTARWPHRRCGRRTASAWSSLHRLSRAVATVKHPAGLRPAKKIGMASTRAGTISGRPDRPARIGEDRAGAGSSHLAGLRCGGCDDRQAVAADRVARADSDGGGRSRCQPFQEAGAPRTRRRPGLNPSNPRGHGAGDRFQADIVILQAQANRFCRTAPVFKRVLAFRSHRHPLQLVGVASDGAVRWGWSSTGMRRCGLRGVGLPWVSFARYPPLSFIGGNFLPFSGGKCPTRRVALYSRAFIPTLDLCHEVTGAPPKAHNRLSVSAVECGDVACL
jgi:hypothetical protein